MKYVTLEEVCENRTSNISQKDLKGNEGIYPIYGASGLIKKVDFYIQDKEYIGIVKDGAGVGRTMLLPSKSSVIGTMQYIIPNGILNIKYLYYALISKKLSKYSSGATIPHIYFRDYKKEKIVLISEIEQQKIVSILDKIVSLIEKNKKRIILLEELVKSRFIEMFGDPIKNEKGWEVKKLYEVSDVRDGTHDSPKYIEIGIPLVTSKNIKKDGISFENVNFISEEDYNNINKRSKVDNGDIIMPMIGTIGNPIIINTDKKFSIKNVCLIKFTNIKLINYYCKYLFSKEFIKIKTNFRGGTQKFISLKDIRGIGIPLPPIYLQEEFSQFVEKTDKLKFEVEKSLKEMENLYDSLMQKFFKQ